MTINSEKTISLHMSSKPKVPLSRRRESGAEAEIKARLSYFSIPAKPEPDIGIDFYCELLDGDSPTSKFFGVQAKGTKNFGKQWRATIKKTTLEHWLSLSFPVFLIVFDEKSGNSYWISIIDNLQKIVRKIRPESKTISITMDKIHSLEKGGHRNNDFIAAIKNATALISLLYGQPQSGEGYVRPAAPLLILNQGVILNLKARIRTNLNYLINHYLLTNNIELAYFLCEFLTRFDTAHYDHFFRMGQICRILGKKDEARKYFAKAIQMCKEDPNWNRLKKPSDPSIEDIIRMIENEMKRL